MPDKFIPEHIDPFRFAEQKLGMTGSVKLTDMPRLRSSLVLHIEKDEAVVNFQFGIDEQGVTFLRGHLETHLSLQCQRCMDPFTYEIITDFVLGIVKNLDEANALPERYEPALTQSGHLALRELIEDEIILNLPIIPRHNMDVCSVKLPRTDSEREEIRKSPFHVLAALKNRRKEENE